MARLLPTRVISFDLPAVFIDADKILIPEFEYGYLSGHSLIMLEQMINEIYIPMLNSLRIDDKKGEHELGETFRNEFHISKLD